MFKPKNENSSILLKLISCTIILLLILGTAFPVSASQNGKPVILHENMFTEPVAKGVEYRHITRFTSDGWLNIHILKVDLDEKDIKVDTLLGKGGITAPETVLSMADTEGAVAAVNGDFFDMGRYPFTIGPLAKGGKLISTPLRGDMAAFGLKSGKRPFIEYLSWEGEVIAPNRKSFSLTGINKPGLNPNNILMFTPEWGDKLPVFNTQDDSIVSIIAENNRVTEIKQASSEFQIPSDGFVLVGRDKAAEFLKENLKPGSRIKIKISTDPDWEKLSTVIGGGAVLVDKGRVVEKFSHHIPGRHPRTAVGFSKDRDTLYFVVVDGRQEKSRGMDLKELAEFMKSIGAYKALNLDGGGSSTMVSRPLGRKSLSTVNTSSDGWSRRIPVGIGVFQENRSRSLKGLKIESTSFNIPLGGSRAFTALGYDQNFNPVDVTSEKIEWSISNNLGEFDNNILKGKKPGVGLVTAKKDRVKQEAPVRVLKDAVKLEIIPNRTVLAPGKLLDFKAYVWDSDGYRAPLNTGDVEWEVLGGVGELDGNRFTASEKSLPGAVVARWNGLESTALISVGLTEKVVDDFSKLGQRVFLGYPENVSGGFEVTASPDPLWNSSTGKLSFEFPEGKEIQAAYMVYDDGGLLLPEGTEKIGVWVYGNNADGNLLKAWIKDANGKEEYLTLSKRVDWCGWQKVEAVVPKGLKHPLKLTRIYIADIDNQNAEKGNVYFSSVIAYTPPDFDYSLQSEHTMAVADPANREVEIEKKTKNDFQFHVFGDVLVTRNYNETYYNEMQKLMSLEKVETVDFTVLTGNVAGDDSITPTEAANTWLSYFSKDLLYSALNHYKREYGKNLFMFLDDSKGGFRNSNPKQWIWLKEQLEEANGSNVFVVLNSSPSSFNDPMEKELFQKLLTQYHETEKAEVWVLYGNVEKFEKYKIDGVNYLGTPGFRSDKPHYIVFTVKDGGVTYQLKQL